MRRGGSTGWRLGAVGGLALLVIGPAVWFLHLSVLYALVPPVCRAGTELPHHLATGGALVALAVTGIVAGRRWRLAQLLDDRAPDDRIPEDRDPGGSASGGDGTGVGLWLDRLLGRREWRSADGTGVSMPVVVVSVLYFALVVAMTGAVPLVVHRCG